MGVQPAQVDVGQLPLRKMQGDKDHVNDPLLEKGFTLGRDHLWFTCKQVQSHCHIVRAEAPERIFILSDLAEIQALTVKVEQLPDFLTRHQLVHLDHSRVIQQQVADHQTPCRSGRHAYKLFGFFRRQGHGLLDQDVLAGFEGPPRLVVMLRGERGDDYPLHGRVPHHILVAGRHANVGIGGSDVGQPGLLQVAHRDQPRALELGEHPHVVLAPLPRAHDRDAERF